MGADLDGVRTLRTMDDARTLHERARAASRAVVVGTGFIGLETAASMRSLGTEVTLVGSGRSLFGQLEAPRFSEHLVEVYAARGVELRLGESVEAFLGDDRLRTVRLTGGEERDAELGVVGIGVEPGTAWLEGSGVELESCSGRRTRPFGDTEGTHALEQGGNFAQGEAVIHYLRDGKRVAALLTGQSEEREEELKKEIRKAVSSAV